MDVRASKSPTQAPLGRYPIASVGALAARRHAIFLEVDRDRANLNTLSHDFHAKSLCAGHRFGAV